VPEAEHPRVLAAVGGHPLALCLGAELVGARSLSGERPASVRIRSGSRR
jgi:hypothetical protein